MDKNRGDFSGVPSISNKWPLFIYNKLNKLQIKLLWVFTNYNKMLGSIKNKKFLNLSDPLSLLFNLTQIKLVPSLENYDEAQTHRIHNYIS